MTPPLVSVLLTVYNKEPVIGATLASLRGQLAPDEIEFVLADDVSGDRSLEVAREALKGMPHVRIIENTRNMGPAVRLNQAAQAASGTYLYCIDSDDIAPCGVIRAMLERLEREDADLLYGRWRRTGQPPHALLDVPIEADAPYVVTDTPLAHVLHGRFVRMTLICERDLYMRAGGCDERLFIQDESLPLRLATHARRMIDWSAPVVLVPDDGGEHLSANIRQQHHDRFFAYVHHLEALMAEGDEHRAEWHGLYRRAVSSYWKSCRRDACVPERLRGWWWYLRARWMMEAPPMPRLAAMREEMHALSGVRRVG